MLAFFAVAAMLVAGPAPTATTATAWRDVAPAPEARSEVVAATVGGRIAVVGGFRRDGSTSARVDLYDPARDRWTRLPDLPVAVNHAMAAVRGRTLYVAGGYRLDGQGHGMNHAGRGVYALTLRRDGTAGPRGWRALPPLPAPRAAGGAAIVGDRLYVLAGVRTPGQLARVGYALDLDTLRWRLVAGPPTRREHLGVAALGRRIYVLAGRTAGFDTNLRTAEVLDTRTGRWSTLAPLPTAHGGCSAATVAGRVVLVGGEATGGTIPAVEAYDPSVRRWSSLPPLEQPRHGLGVAAHDGVLYALLGGPTPGLDVSTTATALPFR